MREIAVADRAQRERMVDDEGPRVGARAVELLTLDLEAAERLLAQGPRLLAVVHASNALGTINPIAELAAIASARVVAFLVALVSAAVISSSCPSWRE